MQPRGFITAEERLREERGVKVLLLSIRKDHAAFGCRWRGSHLVCAVSAKPG
jgi:hypothetical protein